MNLNYIENYIVNILDNSSEFQRERLKQLLQEIENYKQHDKAVVDYQNTLNTLNTYSNFFIQASEEYLVLNTLAEKLDKAQEVLCLITTIDYYLTELIHRESKKGSDSKFYKLIHELKAKKDLYNSERFSWNEIIKSLRVQLEKEVAELELRKFNNDIE